MGESKASVVFQGNRFFREGESFSIVKHSESMMEDRSFHSHDFVEICYVYSGSGYHVVGEQIYEVAKGDLFLINYEVTHTFYRTAEQQELVTYNILFKPGFLDDSLRLFHDFTSLTLSYLFKDSWADEPFREDLRLSLDEQREFDQLIHKMDMEYNQRMPGHSAILRAYTIELIVMMMRGFQKRSTGNERQHKKASEIEAALLYLDTHFHEPIQLAELAKKTFFSKNYFSHLFKEATGLTVSQYTQLVRIDRACEMMRDPDKKIAQIALEVGYADYKAFYLAFKKQKTLSPHAYRSGLPLTNQ
ncbi:AraC family transcriptional regulator [Paenibacillus sp. FSL H7-0331]|uniref:AraC family transcriptional regulator n=1 Tax=Paenibacillus sp. FSL H7-0331 TaxID=1920421 RepID=UPI00096E1AC3|nr:AraC family transcriptional regulator [Paenibacillus sp. FSL H7-0331]OMF20792.1 hypothetical protein BK127_01755 [Paenibacillus sp. FSL H7-0331]